MPQMMPQTCPRHATDIPQMMSSSGPQVVLKWSQSGPQNIAHEGYLQHCTWLYAAVIGCTWLCLGLSWSTLIQTNTVSVYTGLNDQKLKVDWVWGGNLWKHLFNEHRSLVLIIQTNWGLPVLPIEVLIKSKTKLCCVSVNVWVLPRDNIDLLVCCVDLVCLFVCLFVCLLCWSSCLLCFCQCLSVAKRQHWSSCW